MSVVTQHLTPSENGYFTCDFGAIAMRFQAHRNAPVTLSAISGSGMPSIGTMPNQVHAKPIVELIATATGTHDNRLPLTTSVAGSALRFVEAMYTPSNQPSAPHVLTVVQHASFAALQPQSRQFEPDTSDVLNASDATDPSNTTHESATHMFLYPQDCAQIGDGITVISRFEAYPTISAVRCSTTVRSSAPYMIEAVSSLQCSLPTDAFAATAQQAKLYWSDNAWAVENDWHTAWLYETNLRDRNFHINPGISSSRYAQVSTSTWSSGEHNPCGIIELYHATEPAQAQCSAMWQIEHNGPWEWEVSEDTPEIHLTCFGPEYLHHHWYSTLEQPVHTVPAVIAVCAGDWQQAVAHMTLYRRALLQQQAEICHRTQAYADSQSVVVYNDYMNTLFGDPHLETELPLIEGVSTLNVDIFCIDAGWYDSNNGGWWDMVGEWQPSTNRFGAGGLATLAQSIQNHGMQLGLWLEPEVIGIHSPLAQSLPEAAFLTRHGVRISDSGRYLLDFRSEYARAHLNHTIDRLIHDFDVRFFKFDYNTNSGTGADSSLNSHNSVGAGLLEHCRAYLQWLDELRMRHPQLIIENCASGAMRADYAQLSRLDIQSTSDQCDPMLYAGLAASAGLSILPEQQGNWGYAQQSMSDECAVFTLATGILGRLYLSGFINQMDEQRLNLVREAIALHRHILNRHIQDSLVPWWPCGLPHYNDDWLVYGLRTFPQTHQMNSQLFAKEFEHHNLQYSRSQSVLSAPSSEYGYITVWRRRGARYCDIPLPNGATVTQVFPPPLAHNIAPSAQPWTCTRTKYGVTLHVTNDAEPSARIFKVTYSQLHK